MKKNNIKIVTNPPLEEIDFQRIQSLFEMVGWGHREVENIEKSFRCSTFCVFAFNEKELIGVGRAFSDEQYTAMISDLVIDPAFHKKGVGKAILLNLMEKLQNYINVYLISTPGNETFYSKYGWKEMKRAFLLPKRVIHWENYIKND